MLCASKMQMLCLWRNALHKCYLLLCLFSFLLCENEPFFLQSHSAYTLHKKMGKYGCTFVKAAFNAFYWTCISLPCIKLWWIQSNSFFLWLWFSPDAPWCFLSLRIPQGHLHIAQVPQGEQVQITQDSEVSEEGEMPGGTCGPDLINNFLKIQYLKILIYSYKT